MKLKINDTTFVFFNSVSILLNLDSVASSFSFLLRFDPDNKAHQSIFKPLSYPKVVLHDDNDDLLLTGVIINHSFEASAESKLVQVSGYSLGGVLEDCNIPYDNYPLESLKRSLADISKNLLDLFGLKIITDLSATNDMNLIYDKTVAKPTESIKDYISRLASQRNILLSHNADGDIVFSKPNFNASPVLSFNESNTTSISLKTKGQGVYSSLWVLRQPSKGNKGLTPVDTIENPLVGTFRTTVKILNSGTDTDTSKAVKSALASQLKTIGVGVKIDRWVKLKVGDVVTVLSKEIFLYKKTKFVVRQIGLTQNEKNKSMDISLVLPEAYTGETPNKIFDV